MIEGGVEASTMDTYHRDGKVKVLSDIFLIGLCRCFNFCHGVTRLCDKKKLNSFKIKILGFSFLFNHTKPWWEIVLYAEIASHGPNSHQRSTRKALECRNAASVLMGREETQPQQYTYQGLTEQWLDPKLKHLQLKRRDFVIFARCLCKFSN